MLLSSCLHKCAFRVQGDSTQFERPQLRLQAHFSSRLRIEDVEGGRCRQTLEGKVHLRVGFGLGPLAEKVTISQLRKVYHHLPKVVDRYADADCHT